MKYLNDKFYTECKNDKYIIHEDKIYRETAIPKSLKTRYEVMNNTKIDKNKSVIELNDGSLVIVDAKKKTTDTDYVGLDEEENFIIKNASMCMSCNRNLLLDYGIEFVCLGCKIVIDKTKQQLTKLQRKQQTNFSNRLTYAKPKIISICIEVASIIKTDDNDLLATALTYLKQKKLNINPYLLEKFDEISKDFPFSGEATGISRAGNYAINMMNFLISDQYYDNINYYDLIATALCYMKGDKLNVTKHNFSIINDRISLRY